MVSVELPKDFPSEMMEILNGWDIVRKSPYSFSYYNSNDINWGYKPHGSFRISNHWNFNTKNKKHCITDISVPNNTHWCLGQYNSERGLYEIKYIVSK